MIILYILASLLAIILALLCVACIRTLLMPVKKADYKPQPDPAREKAYAEKLSRMVQMETISYADHCDVEKFRAFHKLLEELFPHVFATLEKIDLDGNLLLKWKGKSDKNPILLMSHMDVVEASGQWTHAPSSGDIADGKLWGRGTLDDKGNIWAMLQAAEELLAEGYVPPADLYFMTTCNEECSGAVDMGQFYRVPCDKRGLNYDKFFKQGDTQRNHLTEFNSSNTELLNVQQVQQKLLGLSYIREELDKMGIRY